MNKENKIIEVKNLCKEFKSFERKEGFFEAIKSLFKREYKIVKAVDNISFDISKGEIVGFLGPNGAGKSTTIKMLSGIMHPDSGQLKVMDYIPYKQREQYVGNIGVIFGQKSQLFWNLPPIDSFYLNKDIYSIDEKDFKERLDRLVELLDVKDVIKKQTRQLSLGE
ncbi:MAG: ATP-binding cassette domain-containing protein, partial [archaeon]